MRSCPSVLVPLACSPSPRPGHGGGREREPPEGQVGTGEWLSHLCLLAPGSGKSVHGGPRGPWHGWGSSHCGAGLPAARSSGGRSTREPRTDVAVGADLTCCGQSPVRPLGSGCRETRRVRGDEAVPPFPTAFRVEHRSSLKAETAPPACPLPPQGWVSEVSALLPGCLYRDLLVGASAPQCHVQLVGWPLSDTQPPQPSWGS